MWSQSTAAAVPGLTVPVSVSRDYLQQCSGREEQKNHLSPNLGTQNSLHVPATKYLANFFFLAAEQR